MTTTKQEKVVAVRGELTAITEDIDKLVEEPLTKEKIRGLFHYGRRLGEMLILARGDSLPVVNDIKKQQKRVREALHDPGHPVL